MNNAIKLNNIGVAFLDASDHDAAFESFKVAIELMKQAAAKREEKPARRVSVTKPMQNLIEKFNKSSEDMDLDDESEPRGACFVSKAAFMIPEDTVHDSWVSAVLLYNMALSIHILGLAEETHEHLHRSLKLYRISKQLMAQILEEDTISDRETTVTNSRIVMSILNNMGHVFHLLGDYDISRSFFDGLTQMVTRTAYTTAGIEKDQLQGLLLNAMVLNEPNAAAAA